MIKDDFIVVSGDVITNINIHEALQMHYFIKNEEDKKGLPESRKTKTIMTKLFLKQSMVNPLRDPQSLVTLLLDRQTKEILKYQSFYNENKKAELEVTLNDNSIPFDKSYGVSEKTAKQVQASNIVPKSTSLEARMDLIDCEVAICAVEILDMFNDNFDKQSFKDGFINWLYQDETHEERVRAFEVKQQGAYFGRLIDPRSYGIIT